jgi:hypothetical protein
MARYAIYLKVQNGRENIDESPEKHIWCEVYHQLIPEVVRA